jgi:hypothetical protein
VRYYSDYEVNEALDRLASGERLRGKHDEVISDVLLEWGRSYHPSLDLCPFCKETTRLEQRLAHLLACPAHPAARVAAKLEGALGVGLAAPACEALLAAFTLRNTPRDELRVLVECCVRYEGEWGYREAGVFTSRTYCEAPWLARVDRAERTLGVPLPEAEPPAEVATDVERLLGEAKRWRAALKALWKECRGFWSSMGDDDRGKSLIPERIVGPWKVAIDEAKVVIGRMS